MNVISILINAKKIMNRKLIEKDSPLKKNLNKNKKD